MANGRSRLRRIRNKLHAENPNCHYCGRPTILPEHTNPPVTKQRVKVPHNMATVDHLFSRYHPLRRIHKGEKRYVLACNWCNGRRAKKEEKELGIKIMRERAKRYPKILLKGV